MPKAKPKRKFKTTARKKVERALANPDPIKALDYNDWMFASQLSLGKGANEAARIAYPNWSEETVKANAYAYASRPDIIRAKLHLLDVMAQSRTETVIASKNEILSTLTNIIRTPLSQINEDHPLCAEYTHTVNSNGASSKKKKYDTIAAATLLAKLQGYLDDEKNAPRINIGVVQVIQEASSQGVPIEVTEVGKELLEDID